MKRVSGFDSSRAEHRFLASQQPHPTSGASFRMTSGACSETIHVVTAQSKLQAHLEDEYLRLFHEPWDAQYVNTYRRHGFALGPHHDPVSAVREEVYDRDRERVTVGLDKARRALVALRDLRDELAERWMPRGDPEEAHDFDDALGLGLDKFDELFKVLPAWVLSPEPSWRQAKGTPRGEIVRMMASRSVREIAIVTLLCGERPNRIDPEDPEATVRAEIETVRKAVRRMRERAATLGPQDDEAATELEREDNEWDNA